MQRERIISVVRQDDATNYHKSQRHIICYCEVVKLNASISFNHDKISCFAFCFNNYLFHMLYNIYIIITIWMMTNHRYGSWCFLCWSNENVWNPLFSLFHISFLCSKFRKKQHWIFAHEINIHILLLSTGAWVNNSLQMRKKKLSKKAKQKPFPISNNTFSKSASRVCPLLQSSPVSVHIPILC